MTAVLRALADLLFPPLCLSCGEILPGRTDLPFCHGCHSALHFIASPLCLSCGIPFPVEDGPDHTCGACLSKSGPPAVTRSLGIYESVLHKVIHAFKYGGDLTLGEQLGRLMAQRDYPAFQVSDYSLVVPVPLHPRRLKRRGFNQSVILAREIARRHGIAMDFRALRRTIDTDSQAGLKKDERTTNIRNAFNVPEPDRIRGRSILLVDDVYTTGSTVGECASTLLKEGAERIGVLTLARAMQEFR